jgi:2-phospho-L-lactate guanylyltransferase
MRVYVPYDPIEPKTRLAPALSATEREDFSRAMLLDVCQSITAAGHEPIVLATRQMDIETETRLSDAALTTAVNEVLDASGPSANRPVGVVFADLGLVTPASLSRLFEEDADVVLAPGRRCGTNALVTRSGDFCVDYHGTSYLDHCDVARRNGSSLETVDSYRLGTDIDEPADLFELFVHGEGASRRYLADRFELAADGVELERVFEPVTN